MVYVTVERKSGEYVLAAYGLCRLARPAVAIASQSLAVTRAVAGPVHGKPP